MRYQLVLQFRAGSAADFDKLAVLEDLLIENLPSTWEVDGHDSGRDEFNVFILTEQPEECFQAAEKIIRQYYPSQQLKAVYRELGFTGRLTAKLAEEPLFNTSDYVDGRGACSPRNFGRRDRKSSPWHIQEKLQWRAHFRRTSSAGCSPR